jgi:hypothetical protein
MSAIGALAALLALSGCGGSTSRALPCSPQPSGALCIKVFHDGLNVRDVVTYLSASELPLTGRAWRLSLGRYPCDPGTGSQPSCGASAKYAGPERHGNPPIAVYCRESNGASTVVITGPSGCHDTLAQEMASLGEFAGFAVPKSLTAHSWLCVSEETRVTGSWRPAATPTRACSEISA